MTTEDKSPLRSPHNFLARLVGGWKGMSRLWMEPGKLADESPVKGSIHLILDDRFAIYLYEGSINGQPQHGMFTFGYNTVLDRYEASWVDGWHNNTVIMFCTGAEMAGGFQVLGSYSDPSGGPDWGWRTEVVLEDDDYLVITAYNIMPDGTEARATEAKLTRVRS